MRLERRNGYRVLVGGPVPPQASAITLGNLIVVRNGHDSDWLMSHELVHVRQFAELGAARFLVRYVRSYLRSRLAGYGHMAAYRRIPLEVEASWLSRLHDRRSLEPGSAASAPEGISEARAPRPAVAVKLAEQAEELARTRADLGQAADVLRRSTHSDARSSRRKRIVPPSR